MKRDSRGKSVQGVRLEKFLSESCGKPFQRGKTANKEASKSTGTCYVFSFDHGQCLTLRTRHLFCLDTSGRPPDSPVTQVKDAALVMLMLAQGKQSDCRQSTIIDVHDPSGGTMHDPGASMLGDHSEAILRDRLTEK